MINPAARFNLSQARRLVIKIGSALLVDKISGEIRQAWLEALVAEIAQLHNSGQELILVSSGAIAVGQRHLGLTGRALRLEEKQAAAAIGQIQLAYAYQKALERHGLTVAQLLLTLEDSENRRRYLNARATLQTLLDLGAIPVINENDTVATAEIRFGDNDRLAARVAMMMGADTLILLSDIDGLYTADPRTNPQATHIPVINALTPDIVAMAGKAPPGYSSGGMETKLQAARIATGFGCNMVIAQGRDLAPLSALMQGAPCSWFLAQTEPRTARKQWIAGSLSPTGGLQVDAGAIQALASGKSLLPAGVIAVIGDFQRGDTVVIRNLEDQIIAYGLCAYAATDARHIMGRHSSEIATILGHQGPEVMIHRDDLVLI